MKFSHFIPIAASLMTAPIWVMALDNNPPFSYETLTAAVEPVMPGGTLEVRLTGTRVRICPTEVHERIVDSKRAILELETRYALPKNTGAIDIPFKVPVPIGTAPGDAVYMSEIWYRCNPWQQYIRPLKVRRPDVPFSVASSFGFMWDNTTPPELTSYFATSN